MSVHTRRDSERNRMRQRLKDWFRNPDQLAVIHYSSESLLGGEDGSTPRVTCISVIEVGSMQGLMFSIQKELEKLPNRDERLTPSQSALDESEKNELASFYRYVESRSDQRWIHRNMKDDVYGFPAMAHRYAVHGGIAADIKSSHLLDLSYALVAIYGRGFADDPLLLNAAKLNDISTKDFMLGIEDAKAFERREFSKVRLSLVRKTKMILKLAERELEGALVTNLDKGGQLNSTEATQENA